MAKSLLQTYDENQTQLGVDKISYTQGRAAATPYSQDDTLEVDEQILTVSKLGQARGGMLNTVPYSSTVDRSK